MLKNCCEYAKICCHFLLPDDHKEMSALWPCFEHRQYTETKTKIFFCKQDRLRGLRSGLEVNV